MKTRLLLILLFVSSYTFAQLPADYVAYYEFTDGSPINTADPGNGDLTGTINQLRNDRFYVTDNAIRVGGNQHNGYQLTGNHNNLTIAFWMKGAGPNSGSQRIMQFYDANGNGLSLSNNSSNTLHARFRVNGQEYVVGVNLNNLYNGAWHHVAMVISHDGTVYDNSIYIDSIKNTDLSTGISTANTNSFITTNATFKISPVSSALFYDQIDDILIYERAVTQQEVADIFTYNPSTASITNNEIEGFKLYPNPVNDVLNIDMNSDLDKVEIYNILGAKVLESNKLNVNVSNLEKGVYLINVKDINGNITMKKFLKK